MRKILQNNALLAIGVSCLSQSAGVGRLRFCQKGFLHGWFAIYSHRKHHLGDISPEPSELLGVIVERWKEHLSVLKQTWGDDYELSYYGFAYRRCRWFGLLQPAVQQDRFNSSASGSR